MRPNKSDYAALCGSTTIVYAAGCGFTKVILRQYAELPQMRAYEYADLQKRLLSKLNYYAR